MTDNLFCLPHLESKYKIKVNRHPTLPLAILNYCQISSPKYHPITRLCRGTVVDYKERRIVGRSFPRFFNLGENTEYDNQFNWDDFIVQEKVDGSLIVVYCYDNQWMVNTRGSFGDGPTPNKNMTFRRLFNLALIGREEDCVQSFFEEFANPELSYVFELCSPYNQVVRKYDSPQLHLLGIFDNATGAEYSPHFLSDVFCVVEHYPYENWRELLGELEKKDPTFEGFVLVDNNRHRLKIKTDSYVTLHHTINNGYVCSPNNFVKIYRKGEVDEISNQFPYLAQSLIEKKRFLDENFRTALDLYKKYYKLDNQKEFALSIKDSKLQWLLFQAKKDKIEPDNLFDLYIAPKNERPLVGLLNNDK